jgi:hypothetical protein
VYIKLILFNNDKYKIIIYLLLALFNVEAIDTDSDEARDAVTSMMNITLG